MKRISVLIVMVMVAILGFGISAFAGKGKGGFGNCPAFKNLSPEDQQKVKAERVAFQNDVKAVKIQIREKRQELKSEMAKAQPDAQKASGLQKEISDLKAQVGQKLIQHQINLKNINPALSDCFKSGRKHHRKNHQPPAVAPAPSQG